VGDNRRRNYFIKKSYQAKFSAKFAVLIVLEALLIAGLFWVVSKSTLTTGYEGNTLRIERTPQFFLTSLSLIMLIAAVGVGITAMLVFIVHSHRIAGPLFRLQRDIQELSGGDFTRRLNFRTTDELHELAEALNAYTIVMDGRLGALKNEIESLSRADLKDPVKAREAVDRVKRAADSFKTSP
jgi:methyl-accepting chemotaxis protein